MFLPRRVETREDQVNALIVELGEVWRSMNIPECHRTAFMEYVGSLSKSDLVKAATQELKALKAQEAPILKALAAVSNREDLIMQLQQFRVLEDSSGAQQSMQQYEAADLLHKYRQVSIEVVERITQWRRGLGSPDLRFIWEGVNYLNKMKHDADFMRHSDLNKVFSFPLEHDTFLSYISAPVKKGSRWKRVLKVNLPLSSVMLTRLKKAEIQVKMEETTFRHQEEIELRDDSCDVQVTVSDKPPRKSLEESEFSFSEIIKKVSIRRPSTQAVPKLLSSSLQASLLQHHASLPQISFNQTSFVAPAVKRPKFVAEEVVEVAGILSLMLIKEAMDTDVPLLCSESCREVLVAALVLHSSTILDRLIIEVLYEIIPEVAREAWGEETDIEYVGFQAEVITGAICLELASGVNAWVREVIAEELNADWLWNVYFLDVVEQAIAEEIDLNGEIMFDFYTGLIDDIMEEEWIELLAENELEEALLDSKRLDMDPDLQSELYSREKPFFISKIAESMWFDWLNHILADIWLPRLVEADVNSIDISYEQLFAYESPQPKTLGRRKA
jgi:hypothetical protein